MTKAERRQLMPVSSEIIDDLRQNFGEVTYIHATENSHEVQWGRDIEGEGVRAVTEHFE